MRFKTIDTGLLCAYKRERNQTVRMQILNPSNLGMIRMIILSKNINFYKRIRGVSSGLILSNRIFWLYPIFIAQYNFKHDNAEQGYLFIIFAIAAWIYVI